jgi:DNA replication protein DnaC
MDTPRVLLEHYLKQLRLPTVLREFPKLAEQCAKESTTFEQFLLRLVEQEMLDRERRATARRITAARFPVSKSLETYDFLAIPSLNKKLVVELARGEWIGRRENVLASTAAALVNELIEARDDKRLLRYQKNLARQELLIVDELGFVPLSKTGAERTSTLVTSNLPFAEWTEVLGSERLTGALLDRLTHHVHILEMNGDSFRLKNSRKKKDPAPAPTAIEFGGGLGSKQVAPFPPPRWETFTPPLTPTLFFRKEPLRRCFGVEFYDALRATRVFARSCRS